MSFLFFFSLWLASAFIVALVAKGRMDRSALGFFVLSVLISPVLAGITLAILGTKEPPQIQETEYRIRLPEHLAQDEQLVQEIEQLADQFNAGTLTKDDFDDQLESRVRTAEARRS